MDLSLIPASPSSVAFALLNLTQSPDMGTLLQQLSGQFASGTTQLLLAVDSAAVEITRASYVTVLLIGVLLYFTHLHRRLGRDMIAGGIVLALLAEFVFPAVLRV